MLTNHLKIAVRHLLRRKGYAFINIFGLAVGLACGVLILLFVRDELSYDRFHADADRIYRVAVDAYPPNDAPPDTFALSSQPVGRTLRADYPEAEHVARFEAWSPTVKHGGQYFFDDRFFFAEPSFFDVFTFPLAAGDAATALDAPYSLVMTEEVARKYFGSTDALGRTLVLDDTLTFTVTGVARDVPPGSHLRFDFLVSWSTLTSIQPENDAWLSLNTYTYVKLRPGVRAAAFEAQIRDLIMRHYGEQLRGIGFAAELRLQPLTAIHLRSNRGGELQPGGDVRYVYAFSAIAVFVLLIACVNFMNLATARSMERAKEVGVRKVVGSGRARLAGQFLSESVLTCLAALVVAVGLVAAALPFFNDLAGKEIGFARLLDPAFALSLVGLTVLLGVLAGGYPAFVLSGFEPIEVLKGAFRSSGRGALLRKTLVVFQFAVSVALIVCTVVVFEQLAYMRSQDLGFDGEQVLVIDAQGVPSGQMRQQYETIKGELAQQAQVRQVSAMWSVPGRAAGLLVVAPEGLAEGDSRRMQILLADHDFVETLGIEIVAGRDFSTAFETDAAEALLVNESAVANLGWGPPEEAVGRRIQVGQKNGVIVGVMKDFHFSSLKDRIEPMILHIIPQAFDYFAVRLAPGEAATAVAGLERTWEEHFPGYPFASFFLDEDFDRQYQTEARLAEVFGVFAFVAILIACLGLFGLATFMAEQRTKEIGVRKVLGATVPGIVALLSKDFTRLVAAAVVVASPVAYFAMEQWLAPFPYRISIRWTVFVAAGLAALGVALLTVSYQSVRAALANPVDALRYE